jgi:hypothetical protein
MPLNEADTRAQLIDPLLNVASWTRSLQGSISFPETELCRILDFRTKYLF